MATTTKESSSAEIAKQITFLLRESQDDRHDAARLDELRKIFAKLLQGGDFALVQESNKASIVKQKWRVFLLQRHKQFLYQLGERIVLGKRTAMRTLWGVVATSPVTSSNGKYQLLSTDILLQWIRAMSRAQIWDKSVRSMVLEFLGPYRDVQYYSMIAVLQCAAELYQQKHVANVQNSEDEKSGSNHQEITERAERLVEFLMMIPIPTSQKELRQNCGALFVPPEGAYPDVEAHEDYSDESYDDESHRSSDGDDEEELEKPAKRTKLMESRPKKQRFTFEEVHSHHRAWSKAWMAVLRLDLPTQALKNVLRYVPDNVLPLVPDPLRFADFFMQAYDCSGVVPVFALDGLFLLMTRHGLEYPNFYKQLYKLVTPSLMFVKYRTRFFRLLDKCLSRNEMLPAHVVAAFVKRLIRCTMTGPPSSTLFVLALCSNLLRKHPEVSCLIHRTKNNSSNDDNTAAPDMLFQDQFDAETNDPEESNALQSSLWELGVLEKHYYPAVVTLAKSIGREDQLVAPLHNMEDFLMHTYQSLFEQERKRRHRKGSTPLAFVEPKSLFVENDVFADILAIEQ